MILKEIKRASYMYACLQRKIPSLHVCHVYKKDRFLDRGPEFCCRSILIEKTPDIK